MPETGDPATAREAGVGRSAGLVGLGLVLLGMSAIAFLVLAARATGPDGFAGIAVLWTLIYTVGAGLFVPFEQELSRATAERRAHGLGTGPVLARALPLALAFFLAGCLAALPFLPWLHRHLGDSSLVVISLFATCGCLAAQYCSRGLFSGTRRFVPYALQLSIEAVVRLVGCTVLLLADVSSPAAYAWLLAAAPFVSLLVTLPLLADLMEPGPPARYADVSANLGWLLGAALAAQALANLGTVAVSTLALPGQQAAAGHFMAGLTLTRAPLLLFAAIQAVLLPALVRLLAQGDRAAFLHQLRRILLVTSVVGVGGIAGSWLLGPQALGLLFGAGFDLPRADLTLLATSTAIYMVALVFQPAVIALSDHRGNAIGWSLGVAAFLAMLLAPLDVFLRVELALVVGAAVSVAALATSLTLGLRRTSASRHTPATSARLEP